MEKNTLNEWFEWIHHHILTKWIGLEKGIEILVNKNIILAGAFSNNQKKLLFLYSLYQKKKILHHQSRKWKKIEKRNRLKTKNFRYLVLSLRRLFCFISNQNDYLPQFSLFLSSWYQNINIRKTSQIYWIFVPESNTHDGPSSSNIECEIILQCSTEIVIKPIDRKDDHRQYESRIGLMIQQTETLTLSTFSIKAERTENLKDGRFSLHPIPTLNIIDIQYDHHWSLYICFYIIIRIFPLYLSEHHDQMILSSSCLWFAWFLLEWELQWTTMTD